MTVCWWNFAKRVGAKAIIKGLRVIMDYEAEAQMALINKKIDPDIETVLLVATENYSFISSVLLRNWHLTAEIFRAWSRRMCKRQSSKKGGNNYGESLNC